jgi:DNA-binding IclR family transcriptional regulator
VAKWGFLTNHARVLLCIAHDPGVRLRDIAASLGITERSAYGIVTDLTAAGYVVKEKDGRRNRYQIQTHRWRSACPPRGRGSSRHRTARESRPGPAGISVALFWKFIASFSRPA